MLKRFRRYIIFATFGACGVCACVLALAISAPTSEELAQTETAEAGEQATEIAAQNATATIIALTPTDTPMPTDTPTETPEPSETPLPSDTPEPSQTPTDLPTCRQKNS